MSAIFGRHPDTLGILGQTKIVYLKCNTIIDTNTKAGRKNILITDGFKPGITVYWSFLICAMLAIMTLAWLNKMPKLALAAAIPAITSLITTRKMPGLTYERNKLTGILGINTVTVGSTPVILGVILLIA